jgi:hypothetical protein
MGFLPPPRSRVGGVLVNGTVRQLKITGSPITRFVIQVDGITMYDKPQIIQHKIIEFDILPGKRANLRWFNAGPVGNAVPRHEYEVTVDGKTTRLALLLESAYIAQHRALFQERAVGASLVAFSIFSFFANRYSLMHDGTYFRNATALIPVFAPIGIATIVFSFVNYSWKTSKVGQIVGAVVGASLLAFGYSYFTHWFLNAYGSSH